MEPNYEVKYQVQVLYTEIDPEGVWLPMERVDPVIASDAAKREAYLKSFERDHAPREVRMVRVERTEIVLEPEATDE